MKVFLTSSKGESYRTQPLPTVSLLIMLMTVIDFSAFVSGIIFLAFILCFFGKKTFQEQDYLFQARWRQRALTCSPLPAGRKGLCTSWGGQNPGGKSRWGCILAAEGWQESSHCPWAQLTGRVKTALMPSHQREHVAGSLPLVSAVLWMYHAGNSE